MRKSTKITAVLGGSAVAIAGAGVAYAAWSTSGSGDGSATSNTTAQSVTVNQAPVTGLAPGATASPLSGTFNNPNPGPVTVASLVASFTGTTWQSGCTSSDFSLSSPTTISSSIPSGNGTGSWSGGSVQMLASAGDGCKGQALVIHYVAS